MRLCVSIRLRGPKILALISMSMLFWGIGASGQQQAAHLLLALSRSPFTKSPCLMASEGAAGPRAVRQLMARSGTTRP